MDAFPSRCGEAANSTSCHQLTRILADVQDPLVMVRTPKLAGLKSLHYLYRECLRDCAVYEASTGHPYPEIVTQGDARLAQAYSAVLADYNARTTCYVSPESRNGPCADAERMFGWGYELSAAVNMFRECLVASRRKI